MYSGVDMLSSSEVNNDLFCFVHIQGQFVGGARLSEKNRIDRNISTKPKEEEGAWLGGPEMPLE